MARLDALLAAGIMGGDEYKERKNKLQTIAGALGAMAMSNTTGISMIRPIPRDSSSTNMSPSSSTAAKGAVAPTLVKQPQPQPYTGPITTIYCCNMPPDFTEREFRNVFRFAYGFEQATLSRAKGRIVPSAGFARFQSEETALDAIQILDGVQLDPDMCPDLMLKCCMANSQLTDDKLSSSQAKRHLSPPENPFYKRLNTGKGYVEKGGGSGWPLGKGEKGGKGDKGGKGFKGPPVSTKAPSDTLYIHLGHGTQQHDVWEFLKGEGYLGMKFVEVGPGRAGGNPICFAKFASSWHADQVLSVIRNGGIFLPSAPDHPLSGTYARSSLDLDRLAPQ